MSKAILKSSVGTLVKEYLLITLGLTMYALGWAMFLTPNGMIGGGVTGFAAILQYATNGAIPISLTYFVLNILLLIIGTKILGTGFGAKTIFAIFMTSFMLGVTQEFIPVDFVDKLGLVGVVDSHRRPIGVAILVVEKFAGINLLELARNGGALDDLF